MEKKTLQLEVEVLRSHVLDVTVNKQWILDGELFNSAGRALLALRRKLIPKREPREKVQVPEGTQKRKRG